MTELKPVTEDEIELLQQLAAEIWNQHYIKIISKEQIDYMLEMFHSKQKILEEISQGCIWRILWDNEKPVGYLMLKPEGSGMYLSKIYLKKEVRREGFGELMMDFVKKTAIEHKLFKVSLNVNKHNTDTIRFYEKSGFKKIGEGVFEIGNSYVMDDYIFELDLSPGQPWTSPLFP